MAMNAWNCFVYIMLGVIFLASANCVDSLADIGVDQESCCSSSDLEDQSGFVCYQILKPLLQYLEKCQEMDLQIKELEDKVREQSVEIIKYKSKTEVLSKHLENNFCDTKVMELGDSIDVRIDVQEEIKKLKLELASKESDIIDMNSKLLKKYELLEQKNKLLKETENKLAEKNEYIKQLLEKYFPHSCETFESTKETLTIHVPGSEPFDVACTTGSGWTIVLRELEGSGRLDQKLEQYKEKGFGDLHGSFFIGRKNLYLIAQAMPHQVHIKVTFLDGSTQNYEGDKVVMGGENENYVIKSFNRITRIKNYSIQQSATSQSLHAFFRKSFLPFDDLPDWIELIILIRETL